ncbi:hypothetical protein AVEN_62604-1, partial [Araneus ventricosus]
MFDDESDRRGGNLQSVQHTKERRLIPMDLTCRRIFSGIRPPVLMSRPRPPMKFIYR